MLGIIISFIVGTFIGFTVGFITAAKCEAKIIDEDEFDEDYLPFIDID